MPKVSLKLSKETFSSEAILKAFYKYKNLHARDLTSEGVETFIITFDFPLTLTDDECNELLSGFKHEVVDNMLREKIFKDTEFARNLILANAFSNAPIGDESE